MPFFKLRIALITKESSTPCRAFPCLDAFDEDETQTRVMPSSSPSESAAPGGISEEIGCCPLTSSCFCFFFRFCSASEYCSRRFGIFMTLVEFLRLVESVAFEERSRLEKFEVGSFEKALRDGPCCLSVNLVFVKSLRVKIF